MIRYEIEYLEHKNMSQFLPSRMSFGFQDGNKFFFEDCALDAYASDNINVDAITNALYQLDLIDWLATKPAVNLDIDAAVKLILQETDYTQLIDAPFTTEEQGEISAFRQSVRELTQQTTYPHSVVWPTLDIQSVNDVVTPILLHYKQT